MCIVYSHLCHTKEIYNLCIDYLWMDIREPDDSGGDGIRSGRELFTLYLFLISSEKDFFFYVCALSIQKIK